MLGNWGHEPPFKWTTPTLGDEPTRVSSPLTTRTIIQVNLITYQFRKIPVYEIIHLLPPQSSRVCAWKVPKGPKRKVRIVKSQSPQKTISSFSGVNSLWKTSLVNLLTWSTYVHRNWHFHILFWWYFQWTSPSQFSRLWARAIVFFGCAFWVPQTYLSRDPSRWTTTLKFDE